MLVLMSLFRPLVPAGWEDIRNQVPSPTAPDCKGTWSLDKHRTVSDVSVADRHVPQHHTRGVTVVRFSTASWWWPYSRVFRVGDGYIELREVYLGASQTEVEKDCQTGNVFLIKAGKMWRPEVWDGGV